MISGLEVIVSHTITGLTVTSLPRTTLGLVLARPLCFIPGFVPVTSLSLSQYQKPKPKLNTLKTDSYDSTTYSWPRQLYIDVLLHLGSQKLPIFFSFHSISVFIQQRSCRSKEVRSQTRKTSQVGLLHLGLTSWSRSWKTTKEKKLGRIPAPVIIHFSPLFHRFILHFHFHFCLD